jgi:autotransporter translocation and assembly factor TamB
VLLLATLLVGAAAAVIIVTQTAWFKDWLRGFIVRQANQYLNGQLTIGSLGGNLFFGLELVDLGVTQGGERIIAVKNAGVEYSVIQFVSGNVVIDHIRLDQPTVVLKREAGAWNLAQLVKRQRQEKQRTGPGRSVSIGEVGISDGTFIVDRGAVATTGNVDGIDNAEIANSPNAEISKSTNQQIDKSQVLVPREISRVDARFSFDYEPVHYTIDIGHLSLRGRDPDIELNDLSGRIAERDGNLFLDTIAIRTAESSLKVDGDVSRFATKPVLSLEASSDKFDIPEIARLFPALRGIVLQPTFRVKASGPLDATAFDFAVRSSAGDASGNVTADLLGREHGIKGDVHLAALDLAPIVQAPALKSSLTGLARVDVRFPSAPRGPVAGTFSVSTFSARLAGYQADKIEARGRVNGKLVTVTRGTAVAYGAAATAVGTVEPEVRGPSGTTGLAINLQGAVAGLDLRRLPRHLKLPALDSKLNFDYRVSGVGADVKGDARLRPSTLAGAELADQTTASFSTVGPTLEYAADGSLTGLDIQRYGRGLKIEAISTDRFKSDLNGRFSARGSGTTLPTLTLDATAALNTSTLDAISLPLMDVEAHLANGGGRFRANGGFSNLDPARFTGRPATKGNVAGRVNVGLSLADLAAPVTPESVAASGEVALDHSNVGGLDIDKADVSGDFANATGQIRQLNVTGPDLSLKASGSLALGTSGDSNLAYHFETPDLQVVGKVVGEPSLHGFLSLDGRVTGNRADLRTQGNLKGGNLRYGGADILTAESRYDASIPEFDAERARVKADSTAEFLKVGGQDINVLRATTTYANRELAFDASAEQSARRGRVMGRLLLHPDHEELHLEQLGFTTQGLTWSLAPGPRPTVQYGGGDVTIHDLHLVSGPQTVAAEGTIGRKTSDLRAALTDVDLAHIDTWLIGDRRLGGVLNAAAKVTGPASALKLSTDFSVDGGSFRDFRYETLGGNATYTQDKLAVDVRLQQGPETWATARGTLPMSLFRSPTTPGGAPAPGSDAPVDLAVRSSPIDLGVVQGFTGAITKATGTLLADVRIGGTAAKPLMSGQVAVSNGAFTVTPAGVSYKDMNGRVELQPTRAVIQQLAVTDDHDHKLTLSGELGLNGISVGALKLKVDSRKFEVIHNDLGRLAVNSDLTVGGEVRAPRVEGKLAVDTATIDLDRAIELTTTSAYSTTPETVAEINASPTARGERPAGAGGTPPVGTAGRGQTYPEGAPGAPAAPVEPTARRAAAQAGAAPTAPAGSGSLFDSVTLNVAVEVPDDLVLTGKDIQPGNTPIGLGNVDVTLGGTMRVSKRPAQPMRLSGVVNTVRGTYDFQGRRFDIQRDGRVRFEGGVPVNPTLDILATRLISGVEARVHVGGTMKQPELTLTSNPPLDQADILSLIVFNQPASQLGEGEQVTLAQRAGALATGFVAGKLADSIGSALNLDVFSIQTEATPGGGQGATVTVGEQVGRNLYFKVIQGVGADTLSQFVLDYRLTEWLRLETTMSQGGSATRGLMRRVEQSGADLIFFFSY